MRQSSTKFMDEMLKDNTPAASPSNPDKIAELIDKRVSEAMSEFTKKLEEASSPVNPKENEKGGFENGNNNEGNDGSDSEGGEEGAPEDIDS